MEEVSGEINIRSYELLISSDEYNLLQKFSDSDVVVNTQVVIDWNYIAGIVAKIDHMYDEAFPGNEKFLESILNEYSSVDDHYMHVIALPLSTPIKEVCQAVVKFIKWYNEKKSHPDQDKTL